MDRFIIVLFLQFIFVVTYGQNTGNYEKWVQKKQAEYEKWKKEKVGQTGLPANPEQQRISDFINEGFGQQQNGGNTGSQSSVQPPAQNSTVANINIWAVVVGVASYNDIMSLNYTDDDAYRFYAFLKSPEGGALPDNHLQVLIDEDATRVNILNALKKVFSQVKKNDQIIFYFSGHGAEGALLTHEFDTQNRGIDESGNISGVILHSELNKIFENSPARYKYIIADACHSGSAVGKGVKLPASDAIAGYYQALDNSKGGLVLMLSSMGDEVSIESDGIRQGIFSYNIIEGLKGNADSNKDKIVSVVELFDFVDERVKNYTNFKQNPVISGNYDELMPIGILR